MRGALRVLLLLSGTQASLQHATAAMPTACLVPLRKPAAKNLAGRRASALGTRGPCEQVPSSQCSTRPWRPTGRSVQGLGGHPLCRQTRLVGPAILRRCLVSLSHAPHSHLLSPCLLSASHALSDAHTHSGRGGDHSQDPPSRAHPWPMGRPEPPCPPGTRVSGAGDTGQWVHLGWAQSAKEWGMGQWVHLDGGGWV